MTRPTKVLIVEDDAHIRRLLRAALQRAGLEPVEAATAREGLSLLDIDKPDVVLLDLGLPDRDGLELIQLIKARSSATLLVVSAREDTAEKVAALDLGADDYVTKPFDTEELLARIRTALRHRLAGHAERQRVTAGDVTLDLARRRVTRGGAEVHLSPKEYDVLAELAARPDRVLGHAQLLRTVWGPAHEERVEYLRIVVRNLRQKLEADAARPRLIVNEPAWAIASSPIPVKVGRCLHQKGADEMEDAMISADAPDRIDVTLNYLSQDGVFYNLEHGASTVRFAPYDAVVTNARTQAGPFTLDRNGFTLVRHASAVRDLLDEQSIADEYVPELEALVREVTGARRAIVFQTATRSVDGEKYGGREPVRSAHCDHPEISYRKYAAMVLGEEEAERALRNRWMVVNVWRGIVPVESWPLAVCDGSTMTLDQLGVIEAYDRPGGTLSPFLGHPLKHSPDHRWYYFRDMQPDEALVFKQFDSDETQVKWAAHSAIEDPTTRPDARPRQSIEARVLVLF